MSGKIIRLNVGGTLYTTTLATLTTGVASGSVLAAMFDPDSGRPPAEKDDKGNFFIDGEPGPFEHILRFLRRGKLSEDIDSCTLEQLEWEADYYGLDQLLKVVSERKKAMGLRECMEKTAEMYKKAADAKKMEIECIKCKCIQCNSSSGCVLRCDLCIYAERSENHYYQLASEYEKKRARVMICAYKI